jgi:hypothetical protein
MKRRAILTAAVSVTALVALVGCTIDKTRSTTTTTAASTSVPGGDGAPTTSMDAAEVAAEVDMAGEDGFACELGEITVARMAGGDSLWRSMSTEGDGLEIVTLEGVSYARWRGVLPADASRERRSVVAKLDGRWATWGQPDTILLEELPGTPLTCLEWVGIEWSGASVEAGADGAVTFSVMVPGASVAEAVEVRGEIEQISGMPSALVAGGDGWGEIRIALGEAAGKSAIEKAGEPDGAVTVTQEEYFALVGG